MKDQIESGAMVRRESSTESDLLPASVKTSYTSLYGYVDLEGKLVLPCEFEYAGAFVDGLAPVRRDGEVGFINRVGEMIIRLPENAWPTPFSDGLALVSFPSNQEPRSGYIDRTGNFVIEPRSMQGNPFHNGLALVLVADLPDHSSLDLTKPADFLQTFRSRPAPQHGFINKQGEFVLRLSENQLPGGRNDDDTRFSEGFIRLKRRNKIGYADLSGKFVVAPKFLHGGAFSEGLARVEVRKGRYDYRLAFIDHTGKIVIDTNINTDCDLERNSTNFSEGLAGFSEGPYPNVLKTKRTWGFLDKTGRVVLETPFSYAGPFRDGRAVVYDGKKNGWGCIDKKGDVVVEPTWAGMSDYSDGLAVVNGFS